MTRAVCLLLAGLPLAAAEDAAAIMAKVAANMESGAAARRQYVYQQRVRATISQGGKVNRKEDRTYAVIPHEKSTEKKLEKFAGEYRDGKKMVAYSTPHDHGAHHAHSDDGEEGIADGIDGELMQEMVEDLVDNKKSPDGIPHDLFPLSTADLPGYTFKSLGEKQLQGRRALRIGFEPVSSNLCVHVGKHHDGDDPVEDEDFECHTPWQGEAWIDAEELFPVRIDTKLAKGIPWAVRALLGTNVKQFGFSVTYARAGEGAWFPATYGTEFKINVLFFYKRTISLSLESTDFRKTDTSSNIEFVQ